MSNSTHTSTGAVPRWAGAGLALVLAVGAILRVRDFVASRSLWSDEVRLALNVTSRSFRELVAPMAWDQTAPVPFLWLTKAIVLLAGPAEWAFRLFPFLAGMALLYCFTLLARRLLPLEAGLLAVAMVALSPALIEFSSEFKPYSSDALATVILVLLCLGTVTSDSPRRWISLIVGGVVAILCSSTALFVLAGVWLALAMSPVVRQQRGYPGRLAMAAGLWGGTFAALYLLLIRHTATSGFMQRSWAPHFLTPGTPNLGYRSAYISKEVIGRFLFAPPTGAVTIANWGLVLVGACLLAGVGFLWRRSGFWAVALVAGPILITIVASALRQYPLWPRVLLFLAPLMFLLLAEGAYGLLRLLPRLPRAAGIGIAASLLLGPAASIAFATFSTPKGHSDPRGLIRTLVSERQPGDAVYLAGAAVPEWLFYTTDWSKPDRARLDWYSRMAESTGPAFANRPSRGRPVDHEGWDLRWESAAGVELLGIGSGREFHFFPVATPEAPDGGWAENEVSRMEAEAGHRVWILIAEYGDTELEELFTRLEAHGARRERSMTAPATSGFLYSFLSRTP